MIPFILLQCLLLVLTFQFAPLLLMPLFLWLVQRLFLRKSTEVRSQQEELTALREEQKGLHMVDQFARFSKLERKIKKLEQSLSASLTTRKEKLGFLRMAFNMFLRGLEVALWAILMWSGSVQTIDLVPYHWLDSVPEWMRYSCLVSPPGWLVLPLWLALCKISVHRVVSLLVRPSDN